MLQTTNGGRAVMDPRTSRTRRTFLRQGALLAASGVAAAPGLRGLTGVAAFGQPAAGKPDYKLTIASTNLEIAPGITVKTVAYNGQVPGPILHLSEGKQATIDVTNSSPNEDIVHWH